jgi:pimeloyl-ACP methyl ester carboxylesterase
MIPEHAPPRRRLSAITAVLFLLAAAFLCFQGCTPKVKAIPEKFPEELVFTRAKDDILDSGAIFSPPNELAKPIAIIWIHGWGVNYYQPTYVNIGRALADRGYTCITGNTRMHDLGNVEAWRGSKRIRGGGIWGVASEEVRDLAAWVDFAAARGFKKVVLVGHSAGWAAVRGYQAETQDPRVVGVVLASGEIHAATPLDADQITWARRLMAEGQGDDLVRNPKRPFPSFTSAATIMDIVNSPPELKDFFGQQTQLAGVVRVHCPLLAFFARDDVGTGEDLEHLKSWVKRLPPGPSRVDTRIIEGTDHMYSGRESQVAETIANWADTL